MGRNRLQERRESKHDDTLLRRAAMINGNGQWASITESSLRPTAWVSLGLLWSFSYAGLNGVRVPSATAYWYASSAAAYLDKTPANQDPRGNGVVSRAAALGLFSGYSNGRFGPSDRMTRGQAAVVLWSMAGRPAAGSGAKSFPDVRSGACYYDAVRWASSRGVVSGYGSGRYGPGGRVILERLAAMLANYAGGVGRRQASGSASDYSSMADRARVSRWAVPSVGWCFGSEILSGSGGKVLPQGSATRAEAAKMVVGLHDLLA